ncbi:class I SAM-dependent methyltransferase [Gemmata sp.]|uniref:class I SAM-dependent methyltransferase n=1 Tax=Gemmata sp. TaxID=1914242 RepID=UPI003F718C9A
MCPLTGGAMAPWMLVPCDWRRPDEGTAYRLYWSAAGQFGQLYPRPAKYEIPAFYDVEYYTHHADVAGGGRGRGFLERLRVHLAWRADHGWEVTPETLRATTGRATGSALELGCGDGKLLAGLQGSGWAVVGVDPDPAARKVAAERGLEVHDGTAEEPPAAIGGRTFDLVLMQHVLEHCLDPVQALRVAAGQLKPNGTLVVETPNNDAAGLRAAGAAWSWLDVPRHLNFFTPHSLRAACSRAGLAPVATEYTGYVRQFQRPWIENERHTRSVFARRGAGAPPAGGTLGAWALLARTALARSRYKYDSVRVVARTVPR